YVAIGETEGRGAQDQARVRGLGAVLSWALTHPQLSPAAKNNGPISAGGPGELKQSFATYVSPGSPPPWRDTGSKLPSTIALAFSSESNQVLARHHDRIAVGPPFAE